MADRFEKDGDHNPLITACSNGDLKLVKRLVRKGVAAVNYAGDTKTPLITAVTGGRCKMAQFLITSGADVNQTVINASQLKCLKVLVDNGARLDMKYQGMTPLLLASAQGKPKIVKYLISLPSCSRANKIEALEMLGAYYIDDMDDLVKAHFYWWWSLEERGRAEPGDQVQPKSEEIHPVFQVKEFKTEDELNALEFATDQMWMQSLLIRARVFGPVHRLSSGYVMRCAVTYANRANFDRSITLMMYILDEEHKSGHANYSTLKSFCSLIEMFRNLMSEGFPVKYQHVMAVLSNTVDVFEHMKPDWERYWDHDWGDDCRGDDWDEDWYDECEYDSEHDWELHELDYDLEERRNCTTWNNALDAAVTAVGLLASLQQSISAEDNLEFRQVLYKFVHLNLRANSGHTPLHLACLHQTRSYSPLDVVQLLLEAGADPRAVCSGRDTPLHVLQSNNHPTKPQIIQLLLDSGAHYDACNAEGESFTELCTSPSYGCRWIPHEKPFMPENPMKYVSLQCLSARVVRKNYIPYHSKVPTIVEEFIDLH